MTPGQIIALVRDALIVGALVFLVWRIYTDGSNAVKVKDLQALQTQLTLNAKQQAQWAQQSQQAEAQRALEMENVRGAILSQHAPVILQSAPAARGARQLSRPPTQAASPPAESGGVDLRPRINAFELKYETALADCRAALSSWP